MSVEEIEGQAPEELDDNPQNEDVDAREPESEQEDSDTPNPDDDPQGVENNDGETEEGKEETEQKRKEKRKRSFGSRIKRLTDEKKSLAMRAEEAEQELAELKRTASKNVDDPDNPRPNREEFEEYDDYEAARDEWFVKRLKKEQATANTAAQRPSAIDQARQEAAILIAETGEERYDDFRAVVTNHDLMISADLLDAIAEVENDSGDSDLELSSDVLYYLANNPKMAQEFSKATGSTLARKLGRLATKIELGSIDPKAKRSGSTSSAPKPIKPVGGRDSKVRSIYNKNVSMKEYVAMRRAGKSS